MSNPQQTKTLQPAILALANGTVFSGFSVGAEGAAVGELVFNTAMSGYQEILTDPSYADQIVLFTYPHIGNVGVNALDQESSTYQVKACVMRDMSPVVSNWRATDNLSDSLEKQGVVAISGVDTRALTRILRDGGAQNCCVMSGDNHAEAIAKAQAFAGLEGQNLTEKVSVSTAIEWTEGLSYQEFPPPFIKANHQPHVVAYDFGVKEMILRLLAERGCRVTVVPANTPAQKVLAMKPQGVFLSNGPGDPAACGDIITEVQHIIASDVPVLGICLGFQLLVLALGGNTFKMKFGHHGANHPVIDLTTRQVMVTSQNHGFAADEASLPDCLTITHRSMFDQTIQGVAHKEKAIFAFQGHPEASPGPHDALPLFDQFVGSL